MLQPRGKNESTVAFIARVTAQRSTSYSISPKEDGEGLISFGVRLVSGMDDTKKE
ncbi:MAG: hypothetical protein NTW60_00960 [Candidatus Wolfebacteria bacterium]|nr:hypothetical protein [Candidatus Wolfebacteria bacterium]